MLKTTFISLLVLLIIIVGGVFLFSNFEKPEANLDSFAQCLSDKGAVMYGADWCPHCQNEKASFGESFKLVDYVECPDKPNECLAKGVDGYPTWIFPDGRRFVGEQGLAKLSLESGCPL